MVYRWLILLLAMLSVWTYVSAGVLDKRDFLISQDYSYSEQNNPSIAVGFDGKFAVVWVDYRNGNCDIYCRLYDSGAAAIGDNFVLNGDGAEAWQLEPDLSSDWSGNYYVVWKDYRNGIYPFDPDVYYQRLDSAGFVGANQNVTIEPPDSSHQSPSIGAAGWGKTVVAWTDLRYQNWDVFVQIIDTDGNPIGSNQRVNDDTLISPQHEPEVVISSEGWFVVVWYDGRNGNDDIYLQKYDSAGVPVGSNIRINDDGTSAKQKFPSAAIGGNGTIYLVWTDWRNGNYPDNPDIYGQLLDSNFSRQGGNIQIAYDGSQTSQRDPKVAADQMGNACVIWADSTSLDWDIKGQLFDNTGSRWGGNFSVNLDSEGDQHHPDVSLDGSNLYLTWADKRNGNYDIYGRIYQYNDPSLIASPPRIDTTKDKYDPDPGPIKTHITYAGFGEINYRLETNQGWISLSKSAGITPDSINVSINSSGLDFGINQGKILLVNDDANDTAGFIPVIITITGPIINIDPDSLYFDALIEIGAPSDQTVLVNNDGTGTLNFDLTKSTGWLILDKTTGTDGEAVRVGCDIGSLTAGQYEGYVTATDAGSVNVTESLYVSLSVCENMPYLSSIPDQVSMEVVQGNSHSDSIQIVNLAGSVLNWTAANYSSWLTLNNNSGQDDDFVTYTIISDSLVPGYYTDSIVIDDSLAFNTPLTVLFELTVSVYDSIDILPAQAELGGQFQAPLYLHNYNTVHSAILQFNYDKSMITFDSLGPPVGSKTIDDRSVSIDQAAGTFTITIPAVFSRAQITPDYYHLGDICGTANDSLTGLMVIQAFESNDSFYLELDNNVHTRPVLKSGDIDISISSAVDNFDSDAIPSEFFLDQNSPNPFNGYTNIAFGLERSGQLRLEIFNILGQRVKLLIDEYLSAGHHSVLWNGRDFDGRDMASGLYFYRLSVHEFSSVKKMVYLK